MSTSAKEVLLLSLSGILAGNQVETASIEQALSLICGAFSLNCGLVYESSLSGSMDLSACHGAPSELLEQLETGSLPRPEQTLFLTRQGCPLPLLPLMDCCAAQAMVLEPILDENSALYGLVLLLHSGEGLAAPDRTLLSAALSILVRYVGLRMYRRRLHQSRVTLESILDNTGIDIYVNDFNTHEILYVNQSMAAPYGGRSAFMGHACWQTLFPDQTGPCEFCPQQYLIDSQGLPTKVYTWDYQRSFDGSWFRVFSAAFQWVDGRLAHVVSSADITDNKRNEALVENLANYDQLTKLPNRRMLVAECGRRIDHATTLEHGYVLFFDIDGFKSINDRLGHDAGDEFLVQLGAFFSGIPLLKDSIYRNGGDEFVAIIGGESVTHAHIRTLAALIHERFRKPWKLKKGDIFCSTSIGVACYPEDGVTAETLLQKADMAMYKVKQTGGGNLCFGYQLDERGMDHC